MVLRRPSPENPFRSPGSSRARPGLRHLFGTPQFFLQLLGAIQVAFAIWLLAGFAERSAVAIATIGMWILIVLVAMANPAMLTDPYGALIKDLCLTACAFTVWSLSPLVARKTP